MISKKANSIPDNYLRIIYWLSWQTWGNSADGWLDTWENQSTLLFFYPPPIFYPLFASTTSLSSFLIIRICLRNLSFSLRVTLSSTVIKELLVRIVTAFSLKKLANFRIESHMKISSYIVHLEPSSKAFLAPDCQWCIDEWSNQSIVDAVTP